MRRQPLLFLLLLPALACSDGAVGIINAPPNVSIVEPESGSVHAEGIAIVFRAVVRDPGGNTGALDLTWSSSLDGTLATGAPVDRGSQVTVALPAGVHDITLRAVDPLRVSGTDTVSVTVVADLPPELEVLSPGPDGVFHDDFPVLFSAVASDPEDAAEDLLLEWRLDDTLLHSGPPDDGGAQAFAETLAMGSYVLVVSAADTAGNRVEQTITLAVGGPNHPPECELTAPEDGAEILQFTEVELRGTATDEDVSSDRLTVHWSTGSGVDLGTSTPSGGGAVSLLTTDLPAGSDTVLMTVIDEVGVECVDSADIAVIGVPDVAITSPADGAFVADLAGVLFEGTVSDYEDPPGDLAVNWESDLDGWLGSSRADAQGAVSLSAPALSLGEHRITLSAVDDDGYLGEAAITITVDGAPSPPTVGLEPAAPTTVDDLVASLLVESTGPEGGAISYIWTWDVDGAAQAGLTGSMTVPATSTARDETWTVTVTASDGFVSSLPATATVTVLNSAPVTTTPSVGPALLYTDSNATCAPGTTTDADGDAITLEYTWEISGAPSIQTGPVHSGIQPPGFDLGDDVVCIVTPSDGTLVGVPVASAPLAVANTPPTAPGVAIAPATPDVGDDLLCTITTPSTDLDLQTVTYDFEWTLNGTVTAYVSDAVPASATADADLWECTATPTDGMDFGPSATASATVCLASTWYFDGDGDGFGDFYNSVVACAQPAGYVADYGDCDDADPGVAPLSGDTLGGADTDCDGLDCEAGDLTGAYFVFCEDNGGWSEGETACQTAGYQGLASVLTAGEEAFVISLVTAAGGLNQDPWIGFTDQSTPGTFAWSDGSGVSYTNWGPGQPDGGGGGNQCAVLDANGGDWDDVTCTQSTPGWTSYVCGDR